MPTLAYLGNFSVPYCTEVHVAHAWEQNGWDVVRIQEGDTAAADVPSIVDGADLFCWTQTYGLAETGGTVEERAAMVEAIRGLCPSIGWHLDVWHGLARADQLEREPFFRVDRLFTADGDGDWDRYGIAHRWLRPGVHGPEVGIGEWSPRWAGQVAFVGNWRGGYHPEWPWRREMIAWLRRRYGNRLRLWPQRQAVRGMALQTLYASTKVVVGDSCFADTATQYWSDRPYEAVGRGANLVMPWIAGLADDFTDGAHLTFVPPCDLDALGDTIDRLLAEPDADRADRVAAGVEHVRAHHTYTHRVAEVIQRLTDEGLLPV